MSFVTGRHELCGKIAQALGLEGVKRLEIVIDVDSVVEVTATFYPSDDQVSEIVDAIEGLDTGKLYGLIELTNPASDPRMTGGTFPQSDHALHPQD
jgi:hypothetical protein